MQPQALTIILGRTTVSLQPTGTSQSMSQFDGLVNVSLFLQQPSCQSTRVRT
jgi:hypothetical protein